MSPSERPRRRSTDHDPGLDWLPILVLVGMLIIGAGMMIGSEFVPKKPTLPSKPASELQQVSDEDHEILRGLLQHLGSALVVAALMGLTYEILMERRRHRHHAAQIAETEDAVFRAIAGLTQFNAARLLELLQDVARNIELIPTLFSPARTGCECLFASSPRHFDQLIESARADVVRIVEGWLRGDNANLRFLGSDFVGKYRFEDFLPQMRETAEQVWLSPDWNSQSTRTKAWVLNYMWAVSAAECNKLRRMSDMLVSTDDLFTRLWILHIPTQMPELDGTVDLVNAFLRGYMHQPTVTIQWPSGLVPPAEAQATIRALAAIERHHRSQRSDDRGPAIELLKQHRVRFAGQAAYVKRSWLGLHAAEADLPPDSVSRSARVVHAERGMIRVEDDEKNVVEAQWAIPIVPSLPKIDDKVVLVGTNESSGRFVPIFAELPEGLVAPVLSIKSHQGAEPSTAMSSGAG